MNPVIIFSCTGLEHLVYCVWSIRSLKKLGYDAIEVIVGKAWEKEFIDSRVEGVPCTVVEVNIAGYGMWAFRPFALKKYEIKNSDRDVVICDTDILWKRDPAKLFKRFEKKAWVHKITSLNPKDLDTDRDKIPRSRIGLKTMVNYKKRWGLERYLNFHLNCGLFMLSKDAFPKVLEDWVEKIKRLPPKEMIMTEALLSLVYADMGLSPVCDRDNIKHFGMEHDNIDGTLISFNAQRTPAGAYTGYQTAQHYYGDQRAVLHKDAKEMGLDSDGLAALAKKDIFGKGIKKIPRMPKIIIGKLWAMIRDLGIRRRPKHPIIYYVVDSKGWVQHRRFKYLKAYLRTYRFRLLTRRHFRFLWKLGLLRSRYIFFSTWRGPHALIKDDPNIFKDSDYRYFMAAVTSHSNIGGGLDPLNPIPGRGPREAFDLAAGLLKKFKVVSANSRILYEMLKGVLPNLVYCPNGVDTEFFTPNDGKEYNPKHIRIGWVGKVRGPKNFSVIEDACKRLESFGVFKPEMVKVSKKIKRIPLSFEDMKEYYKRIDFYLCASLNEGTPNPALEAGASGVPVVTTRVGNMRELIRPEFNGFFVEPTAESIVRAFKSIADMDRERYLKMSENMRSSITEEWSWVTRINNFGEAFERLVS